MDKGNKGLSIGISSIIVMFAVIVMSIFAVLSLSTANEEKELAEKYAASVRNLWAADRDCAHIANELGALHESGADEAELEAKAMEYGAEVEKEGGELIISYSRAISDISDLNVSLRIGAEFTVARWQMTTTEDDWQPDYSIRVWRGEDL